MRCFSTLSPCNGAFTVTFKGTVLSPISFSTTPVPGVLACTFDFPAAFPFAVAACAIEAFWISGTVFKMRSEWMGDDLVSVDKELSRKEDSEGLHPDEASNYIDACLDVMDYRSKSNGS